MATHTSWTTHSCNGHVGFARYWFASRCSHRQRCSCGAACGVCSRPLLARVVKKESGRIVDCAANVARTQYHQPNSTQRNTTSLLDSSVQTQAGNKTEPKEETKGRHERPQGTKRTEAATAQHAACNTSQINQWDAREKWVTGGQQQAASSRHAVSEVSGGTWKDTEPCASRDAASASPAGGAEPMPLPPLRV